MLNQFILTVTREHAANLAMQFAHFGQLYQVVLSDFAYRCSILKLS